MFILGFFWKRTTASAAIVGLITGFLLALFFNNYAPAVLGNETILYTAFPNGKGGFEIPFLIGMGWSFFFTMVAMIAVSFATGPKENPKAFVLDKTMFKLAPNHIAMIVVTLIIITLLYARFW